MNKNQRISLFFTLSIVLAILYFLFGNAMKEWVNHQLDFKKELVVKDTGKKGKEDKNIGKAVDAYEGVKVFYNGRVANVSGRNTTEDGYNLGLKYQCVEFVKRFYYEKYNHKMPNSFGHAKEFYNPSIADGAFNKDRGLTQYDNPSNFKPSKNALLVYGPTPYNSFGHVAIITSVTGTKVEAISQNLGKGNGTRRTYELLRDSNGKWSINEPYILGWLVK